MNDSTPSCGGTLVSTDGRTLPLRSARLSGRLCAGLGRVHLEQTFQNPHAEPLRVTYELPLPEDGAVSGCSFKVGDREIVGEVDRKDRARERFEEAIAEGRTAAHLEQERASLFTQEVGNIPPETRVVVRIEIDQRLAWIPDADAGTGGWEWRFPTVVASRYLGAPGRVADAPRVAVDVAARPRPIKMSMAMTVADELASSGTYRSPSRGLSSGRDGVVSFADEGVGLDRDVVLRWPVATPTVGLSIDVAQPEAGHAEDGSLFGLLAIVPPSSKPDAPVSRVNRSLTGPAARAGRGVEVVIGLGEDSERASRRLLEQPIVVDLAIEARPWSGRRRSDCRICTREVPR